MWASLIYSLLRVLLDAIATSRRDRAKLEAEVLALRRQVQVLERRIKRVRWSAGDRMVMAALARAALAFGVGRPARSSGNRARLAPGIGAPEMGRIQGTSAQGQTADLNGVSRPDCPPGQGEPELGLLSDFRRADQARLYGGRDHDSLSAGRG